MRKQVRDLLRGQVPEILTAHGHDLTGDAGVGAVLIRDAHRV